MDVETREKTSAPRGVIGCLTAGFEMLGRNLWLIALPVLLDLFLWLGPRLSVAPLLQRFVAVLKAQPPADPEMARQVAQAIQLLEQFGEQFNLLSLLSGIPLLHIPSLLARHVAENISPLGEPRLLQLSSFLALIPWWIGLVLIGLALGALYLGGLARCVRAMRSPAPSETSDAGKNEVSGGTGRLIRLFLFGTGLLMIGVVSALLWMLMVGAATVIAQSLGVVVWMFGVGLIGYAALHLMFVAPGVLLGGRGLLQATWESVVLSHTQLSSVMGLVILTAVIYEGLGYAWSLPSGDSWSLLIGILGNAAVATGLTAALFVFYQERVEGEEATNGRHE